MTLFEAPEVLRRRKKRKPGVHKRNNGTSIDSRPQEVDLRNEFGHWESDTVIGQKRKTDNAIFTIVERVSGYYLSIKISGKNTCGIAEAITILKQEFGNKFDKVFRTITTDNGPEFANFSNVEATGTKVYFAHPYSAWERPINERTNRILRRFIPKGKSIDSYTEDEIRMFSDEINSLPRKRLSYHMLEEIFEKELDKIYASISTNI